MVNKYDIHYVRNPLGYGLDWAEDSPPTETVCGKVLSGDIFFSGLEPPITCPDCLAWIRQSAA